MLRYLQHGDYDDNDGNDKQSRLPQETNVNIRTVHNELRLTQVLVNKRRKILNG